MKRNRGLAILLIAILLQLGSVGMEVITLLMGVVGLTISSSMTPKESGEAHMKRNIVIRIAGQFN